MSNRALHNTYHTVRHLKRRQIVSRLWLHLQRLIERPAAFAARPTPPLPEVVWKPLGEFLPPALGTNTSERLQSGDIGFLSMTESAGWPPRWGEIRQSRLWLYSLHYFNWLWALDYEEGKAVVEDWIVREPLRRRSLAWEPYPVSLRLVNWCTFFLGRFRERTIGDRPFFTELWHSIYIHAEWLRRHQEFHLMGNHLLENVAALALAGSCFSGSHAGHWLKTGTTLLKEQLQEQILTEGGHYERSPMYHARVLHLLALLANTGHEALTACVWSYVERMAGPLAFMCHPDGGVALLNDSARGEYIDAGALLQYVESLTDIREEASGPFSLTDIGYYGDRCEDAYIICDAGPIGPDHQPGHAHGDIFSFELSLCGHRVIVDSGVFNYEPGETRVYCRSTRAHNTLEIDGQDQCEFWATFRVARRGQPHDIVWEGRDDGFVLAGWHDGYFRLEGKPKHIRSFDWERPSTLTVRDAVQAKRSVHVVSRIHLHPSCRVESVSKNQAIVSYPAGKFTVVFSGDGQLEEESSFYFPEFGKKLDNTALVFVAEGKHVTMSYTIKPFPIPH